MSGQQSGHLSGQSRKRNHKLLFWKSILRSAEYNTHWLFEILLKITKMIRQYHAKLIRLLYLKIRIILKRFLTVQHNSDHIPWWRLFLWGCRQEEGPFKSSWYWIAWIWNERCLWRRWKCRKSWRLRRWLVLFRQNKSQDLCLVWGFFYPFT